MLGLHCLNWDYHSISADRNRRNTFFVNAEKGINSDMIAAQNRILYASDTLKQAGA